MMADDGRIMTGDPFVEGEPVPFNYKYLMITFMIIKYCWEQYINMRQLSRNLIREMPPELARLNISLHDFLLSQSYSFDKMAFQMLALSIRMAVDCLAIMCNLLPFIWENVNIVFPFMSMDSEFQRAVGYVLVEAFISKAFWVPISVYQTFVIEKKYNLTNKTVEIFVYDLFVEAVLMLIIFPPIIYGYLKVVEFDAEHFYFSLQIFVIAITIVLIWIHPNLIAPLFNNFIPLKNEQLRAKIVAIAHRYQIVLGNIFVINTSVRSAHSNAYMYGIGTVKTIVVSDSLLKSLSEQETLSVVGHELGHSYHSHSLKKMVIYLLEVLSMFYIFGLFIKNDQVFISFGFTEKSVFICTALYFHLFEPLVSTFNLILLIFTRKCQFQADSFSCSLGLGKPLKSGLIKLFKESITSVKPDYLYAWIKDSHPNIYQRIDNIHSKMDELDKKQIQAKRRVSPRVVYPLDQNDSLNNDFTSNSQSSDEDFSDYDQSEDSSFSASQSAQNASESRRSDSRIKQSSIDQQMVKNKAGLSL